MNITLTTPMVAATHGAKIAGIENVNVNWNAFGTAIIEAGNITGATITGTSSKTGFLGSMDVNGAGANTVVAGSGMVGTLTVKGATTSVVDAGAAKSVSVTGTADAAKVGTLTLNAGTNTTTITAATFDEMTINAGTAKTISLTDELASTKGNTATLNFGANATLANAVDKLTVNATAADLTLTIDAVETSLDVAGTNNTTIKVADASDAKITAKTITKSSTGALTFETGNTGGAADLSKIAADSFVFSGTIGGAVTLLTAQTVTLAKDANAASFTVGSGTADTLTLNVSTSQNSIVSDAETTTINIAAEAVANAADATFATINAGTNKVVLNGSNDIVIGSAALTAKELDASAYTGELTITQSATTAMDINGGTGKNTVVFKSTTADNNYVGQNGIDDVTFATTTGSANAVLGNGNNKVTANAVTVGDLVVIAGSGNDTVSATALVSDGVAGDSANVTLELGDGNNKATVKITNLVTAAVSSGVNLVLTTGAGNDELVLDATTTADDTLNLTFGEGTDTLSLTGDLKLGTITQTGLDIIKLSDETNDNATVNSTLISGKTITVTSTNLDGNNNDTLTVVNTATTASTIDLSLVTLDRTVDTGIANTIIIGSTANVAETIIGTAFNDVITADAGTNTITGGKGVDTLVGGAGTDTYVFAAGDTGITAATIDSITTAFTSGTDKINFGLAGSVTNYLEAANTTSHASAAVASFAEVLASANNALNGTVQIYVTNNAAIDSSNGNAAVAATQTYVFFDRNADGTADEAIAIVGNYDSLAYTDFIA